MIVLTYYFFTLIFNRDYISRHYLREFTLFFLIVIDSAHDRTYIM